MNITVPTEAVSKYHDDNSYASDPIGVTLSLRRYRRLRGLEGLLAGLIMRFRGVRPIEYLNEHLQLGDSRASVVVSTSPLLVAAYSDELDCVAMLRFPDRLVREHDLRVGERLLTVNTYMTGIEVAEDLVPGPEDTGRYVNFYPLIADFLSDDREKIEARKRSISDREWRRCEEMGTGYLRDHPERSRDGNPLFSELVE